MAVDKLSAIPSGGAVAGATDKVVTVRSGTTDLLTTPVALDTAQTWAGQQTFVSPVLGTPASGNLANCTFPTLNQNTAGSAASLSATLIVAQGGTGATTLTGLVVGNGTSAFTTVTAPAGTVVGTTDSQTLTNKTLTSPTLTTPVLGTPASGNLANCTFPTLNQNTTGSAGSLSATLIVSQGGTGLATTTAYGMITGGTTATGNFQNAGTGTSGQIYVSGGSAALGTWTSPTTAGAVSTVVATDANGNLTANDVYNPSNAITASGNAATVPVTKRINTVTNNSAATLTITMTTAGAGDGWLCQVRILDASAVAQTITWVNTENSLATAPTISNGSTTLPVSVLFQYNSQTSKWRCIAVS
jgi:hypothetical protein